MATHNARSGDGFVPFFRRYTTTWVHAVATAGMTAFGTLTIVHRLFVLPAIASYVLPPIVLYLRQPPAEEGEREDRTGPAERMERAREDEDADRVSPERTAIVTTEGSATDSGTSPAEADEAAPEGADESERTRDWTVVDVPTETTLNDVCVTETGAVYAVGDDGLVLAASAADDDAESEWSIALADGPAAAGEDLSGVDATSDGEAVWIAGDSGAVGRLEADTDRHEDYTAPAGITDNWPGVAVGGVGGDETILLINGSGAVCRGRYRDGDVSWDDPVTPGDGSSLSGIALADASVGYCCDTNDGVFETTDGGKSFDGVGPVGAGGTLETLATLGRGDCLVSADDGVVHRRGTSTWTPERVGEEAVCGIARREGETIACDADGAIYERDSTAQWERVETRSPESLLSVSTDSAGKRAVAVGENGSAVERR
ncbi:sialidase family protein [Natrinema caseinilyticum]|uniref:sialidase family protein n=1 Tax=Natrinema caseinilyticum TaxID=2961570 RepID=UPI0020C1C928|nr:hypothetical protein [Natrinema caseinilyticum]